MGTVYQGNLMGYEVDVLEVDEVDNLRCGTAN